MWLLHAVAKPIQRQYSKKYDDLWRPGLAAHWNGCIEVNWNSSWQEVFIETDITQLASIIEAKITPPYISEEATG